MADVGRIENKEQEAPEIIKFDQDVIAGKPKHPIGNLSCLPTELGYSLGGEEKICRDYDLSQPGTPNEITTTINDQGGVDVSDSIQVRRAYRIEPNIAYRPQVARLGETIDQSVYFVLDPEKNRLFSFSDNSEKEGERGITEDDLKETQFVEMHHINSIQRVGDLILVVGAKNDGETTLILVNRSGEVTSEKRMGQDFGGVKKVIVDAQNPGKFTLLSHGGDMRVPELVGPGKEVINKNVVSDRQSHRLTYLNSNANIIDAAMNGGNVLELQKMRNDKMQVFCVNPEGEMKGIDMDKNTVGVTYLENHPYSLHQTDEGLEAHLLHLSDVS